jgi:hypothetical protein
VGTAALITLAAAQLAAAPLIRAASNDCSSAGAATRAMTRHIGRPPAVAQRLDGSGVFTGRSLTLPGRGAISLPPDSFVSDAVGDALVYTSSNGGRSEIHLVDLAAGCDAVVARPPGVVRSAILSRDGSAVYVHSVTFPARDDAGVTRYALDGSAVTLVVPPLPNNKRFGLTFGTQLGWSTDDAALFVQSCALEECRTRVLDLASGAIATFDADAQGPIIGLTPRHLVTYAACGGLPCPVLGTDLSTGAVDVLVDEAWDTSIATSVSGSPIVRIDTAAGTTEIAQ